MEPRRNETQIAYHRRRLEELKQIRSPWEADWQALADHIEPSRLRLASSPEGAISRAKILDSTGTFALRTLASGMHSGVTSPARPWFKLTTPDPGLKDFGPVKEYLAAVETRMRDAFATSNLYRAFHQGYGDLGQFGQSCGILVENDRETLRMQQFTHGRFWIARDADGRATTLYRQFRWSVQRIVERFGLERVSQRIRTLYDSSDYDKVFEICHAIEPRLSRDPSRIDRRNKAFLSNYWEAEGNEGRLLDESGFDENPIIAPPWELTGEDHYALSPGQIALGDVRMLNVEQKRKLEAIDKMVRPPMTGPTSMRNNPASLLPGAVTYVDDVSGRGGFRPAMEVRLSISELANDIRETQDRVNRAFYADLFLMLSQMEGIQPRNQFELAERKEEKLLALGPVLENIFNDQLEPVIDRTFAIMNRRGDLPPPPAELEDTELKIEYTSVLAQAMKAVSTGSLERGLAFVGNLAGIKPEVMDKVDLDEAVDTYFEYVGAPPSILVSQDEVADVRRQRAEQQQRAANAEMAAQMAPAAKQGAEAATLLAETDQGPGAGALLQRLGLS